MPLPLNPLTVPADLDQRFKPRLEYREPFWTEAFDGDWAARNRMNSDHARLTEQHGGKISYGTFVHTFEKILHPNAHFEKHPEYFSMVKGKRIKDQTQLCLTNPEVLRATIERVKEWIAKNPNATGNTTKYANDMPTTKKKQLDTITGSTSFFSCW